MRAVAAQHHRRIVPGVRVVQLARRAIQPRIKKRNEPVAQNILVDRHIQPRAQIVRRDFPARQRAHRRLQVRHQHRRRHAFPRHVGDA